MKKPKSHKYTLNKPKNHEKTQKTSKKPKNL